MKTLLLPEETRCQTINRSVGNGLKLVLSEFFNHGIGEMLIPL